MNRRRSYYDDPLFTTRAIEPEVADARGYHRFGGWRGLKPIREADPRYDHPDCDGVRFQWPDRKNEHGQIVRRGQWDSLYRWSRAKFAGTTGWAMRKHALPGSMFDAPLAQMRPDDPLPDPQAYEEHDHDAIWDRPDDTARLLHEEGSAHRYPSGELLRVRDVRLKIRGRWREVPLPLSEEEAERGLGRELPLEGPHGHLPTRKYLVAPGRGHGKRWDTNRLCTTERFLAAERVFLHLEGCLKLDALVSAGEVGADVPSVTLWHRRPDELTWTDFPRENLEELWLDPRLDEDDGGVGQVQTDDLRDFLLAHVRTPVIIVCDSDWMHIPSVALEAFSLRDAVLDVLDVPCYVAAPPIEPEHFLGTDRLGRPRYKKRGSDDFQFEGGQVDGLMTYEPRDGSGYAAFERAYREERGRSTVTRRGTARNVIDFDLALLRWYALHSTRTGLVEQRPQMIAERLRQRPGFERKGRDAVRAATLRLEEAGALTIDGPYDDPDKRPRRTREEWAAIREAGKARRKRLRDLGVKPPYRAGEAMITLRYDLTADFADAPVGVVAPRKIA